VAEPCADQIDVTALPKHDIGLMKTRKKPSKNIVTFAQSMFQLSYHVTEIGTIFPE